ncbi:MAG: amino acid permease [Methanoregula sp.]|nr:MAG: amino acid permease [Methanoregula sp.]
MAKKEALRRELGLVAVTLSGVGIILGAGVYALIGQAAGLSGNAVWLAFALAALLAAFTGLSYAELSSMFPRSGAEYEYVSSAFGNRLAFAVSWLIILSGALSAATVALGFAGYFSSLTGSSLLPAAAGLILLLTAILLYGVKETAYVAIGATLIEAFGLCIIIAIGIPRLGSVDYLEMPAGLFGLFAASALIFFAYQGFEAMVKFSDETRNPERTVPQALLFALAISTVLYILVALCAVSVVPWQQIAASKAPFTEIVAVSLGGNAVIVISLIALFATANTALMSVYASSRILHGMGGSSYVPALFARVLRERRTPHIAILASSLLSLIFLFSGDIAFVANLTNFTLFVTFVIINAAVIVLRIHAPDASRPFRIPGTIGTIPIIPVAGMVFSFFLLAQLSVQVLMAGLILAVAGIAFTILKKKA